MKLWVTPAGDRWLCEECEEEIAGQIEDEGWRMAFEQSGPMLRCSSCRKPDIEIFD